MRKFAFLGLVPIVAGVALIAVSAFTDLDGIIGVIVLFGGSFAVALLTSVIAVVQSLRSDGTDKKSDYKTYEESLQQSDEEEEAKQLEKINSSYGFDSRMAAGMHELSHARRAYRSADRKEKFLGILLVVSLLTMFALIFVFGFLGLYIGTFIAAGGFVFEIVACIIGLIIRHRISMSQKYNPKKYQLNYGTVRCSTLSSNMTTGKKTVRIRSAVYRVQIFVGGKIYNAYSTRFYNEGERVKIAIKSHGSLAKIIVDEKESVY